MLNKEKLEQVQRMLGADNMSAMRIPMMPKVEEKDLVNPVDTLYNDFMDIISGIETIRKALGQEPPKEFYRSVIFFQRIALGCVLEVCKKLSESYDNR